MAEAAAWRPDVGRREILPRPETTRCLCGYITYEYSGPVGPAGYCHCEDCRRCTGSAFNISVRLSLAEFRITSGNPKPFTKRGDSGNELTRHFCPECGSPIFQHRQRRGECRRLSLLPVGCRHHRRDAPRGHGVSRHGHAGRHLPAHRGVGRRVPRDSRARGPHGRDGVR